MTDAIWQSVDRCLSSEPTMMPSSQLGCMSCCGLLGSCPDAIWPVSQFGTDRDVELAAQMYELLRAQRV